MNSCRWSSSIIRQYAGHQPLQSPADRWHYGLPRHLLHGLCKYRFNVLLSPFSL